MGSLTFSLYIDIYILYTYIFIYIYVSITYHVIYIYIYIYIYIHTRVYLFIKMAFTANSVLMIFFKFTTQMFRSADESIKYNETHLLLLWVGSQVTLHAFVIVVIATFKNLLNMAALEACLNKPGIEKVG